VGCVVGCVGCVGCNEQSRPLLTFDIPQTALVATLDTYDFLLNKLPIFAQNLQKKNQNWVELLSNQREVYHMGPNIC
jgi:hypothetical protein